MDDTDDKKVRRRAELARPALLAKAVLGNSDAQFQLGKDLVEFGDEREIQLGFCWLQLAAASGARDYDFQVGDILLRLGPSRPQNIGPEIDRAGR